MAMEDMTVADLITWLVHHAELGDRVRVEAGGDGAIHYGPLRHARPDGDGVVLSGESP